MGGDRQLGHNLLWDQENYACAGSVPLQQSKELQWFKVFLSPSNLANTSVGIVVRKGGISFPNLMWHIGVPLPASSAEGGTQSYELQGLRHGHTIPLCRGGDLPKG